MDKHRVAERDGQTERRGEGEDLEMGAHETGFAKQWARKDRKKGGRATRQREHGGTKLTPPVLLLLFFVFVSSRGFYVQLTWLLLESSKRARLQ